ncbi:phosphopantothenate/pantothenate synthetase [archaeon]
MTVPKDHPRFQSLEDRHKIEEGIAKGYTTPTGMIAHGRGEAFDYLIGEQTTEYARAACEAAAAKLLSTTSVLSANGNVAALCAEEYVALSEALNIPIEINLFYRTPERMKKMEERFLEAGAKEVLGVRADAEIPSLTSERRKVDSRGIYSRDTVLVPLEDGDRTEHLKKMGKFVIALDLNPLSRTAQQADITIIDNITRAVPLLIELAKKKPVWRGFDNSENLRGSMETMSRNLTKPI